jgi:RNA polymerase sigma factor for flagellar operon FliA
VSAFTVAPALAPAIAQESANVSPSIPSYQQRIQSEQAEQASRDAILMQHMPEVQRIARKIHQKLPAHVALEDLVHAGVLGLIDATQKYSAGRNVEFRHYAKFRIRGAILDSLREGDWGPRALRKQARAVNEARFVCKSELGREPDEAEVAAKMGLQLGAYQKLVGKLNGLEIDELPESGVEERRGSFAATSAESPFSEYLRVEILRHLGTAMNALPARENQVLVLCDFEERTMKEVGKILGVGESRVSQIRTEAVAHLRDQLRDVIGGWREN